jgi:hypothetical protein
MARSSTDERDIEKFAEELGKMLGAASARAVGLRGHDAIAAELESVLDRATGLLDRLTGEAGARAPTTGSRRRDTRSAGTRRVDRRERSAAGGKKKPAGAATASSKATKNRSVRGAGATKR